MKQQKTRSGSALIVVLGMMAVLMIMAVAFSVFMRTERSGMTNLKHALTARQTTQTAISRVMAAIDQSFINPINSWPIPDWNPPYISSSTNDSTTQQFWQNTAISNNAMRVNNARLLTEELSRHLSPSQLALAKNAKVEWVNLRSGVGASKVADGVPTKDMIVARYAFLAFNTTGLLDMNSGPTTNSTDDADAIIDTSFVYFMERAVDKYNQKNSPQLAVPDFIATRKRLGAFSSYAEMWRSLLADYRYVYVPQGENSTSSIYKGDLEDDDVTITPDLFNTFSMSLDEVDPDGQMKLYVPTNTASSVFTDVKKKAYAKLALERFKRIFNNENNGVPVKLVEDPQGPIRLPSLTRAELATQALIDYIDEDSKSSGGFWLPSSSDPLDYLNYPCTESVPMVQQAFAAFESISSAIDAPFGTPPAQWSKEWTVKLQIGCDAYDFGLTPNVTGYSLDMQYDLVNADDVFLKLWGVDGRYKDSLGRDIWTPSFPDGQAEFPKGAASTPGVGGAAIAVNSTKTLKIKVFAKSWGLDGDGNPDPTSAKYPEFSAYHEADTADSAIVGPKPETETMRLEVAITATVKKGSDIVQQVPAPKLGNAYRIRVAPGLYHLPSRLERDGAASPNETGWAFCLDPRFAYNTVGMTTFPGNGYRPWICNLMCNQQNSPIANATATDPRYNVMLELANKLVNLEKTLGILPSAEGLPSRLLTSGLLNSNKFDFQGVGEVPLSDLKVLMETFSGFHKIYPDVYHAAVNGGANTMFIDNGENAINGAMVMRVANAPIKSMSEFGNLVIGPWETLSLFATFAPGGEKVDFHRVSDYFSLNEARFPKASDIDAPSFDINMNKEYFPALYYGKLNLNAPFKVKCDDTEVESGVRSAERNFEPLAAVLTSIPVVNGGQTNYFGFLADAVGVASNLYDSVKGVDISGSTSSRDRGMFRYVSDIANVTRTASGNPILKKVIEKGAVLDVDREAFIGNALDRLTTRGQTYTVIIRADAYSPKYGSTSAQEGTTLATEYALLELWRDSEPNRKPNGEYYPSGTTTPVHSWFIRSCRFFSP